MKIATLSFRITSSTITRPTKRAPDAGDSAAISSIFLRLSLFLAGRLRRPRPSAGNANRWAAEQLIGCFWFLIIGDFHD